MTQVRIGTRKSKLAMWQTEMVADLLHSAGIKTTIASMETIGDKRLDTSIAKIGSKGVFTEELETQLAEGTTDIAVHSAKDMPSVLPENFELIAFTSREAANDVLLSKDPTINIDASAKKLKIGTASVRRVALLRHFYPHVETVEVRGNLQTRIKKMDEGVCDALMLAYAGVKRMGYEEMIVKKFPTEQFVPPVGQGCIAIEAHSSLDASRRDLLRRCLNDETSEICLLAERAYLKILDGGCSIPAFGMARLSGANLTLCAGLVSLDGKEIIKKEMTGPRDAAIELGKKVGTYILDHGGRELLTEIRDQQQSA